MVAQGGLGFLRRHKKLLGSVKWVLFGLWFGLLVGFSQPVMGLRPLRERARSWGDEVGIENFIDSFKCFLKKKKLILFCFK